MFNWESEGATPRFPWIAVLTDATIFRYNLRVLSRPILLLTLLTVPVAAFGQSKIWGPWSDAGYGTQFSWCVVQKKDPVSTWRIQNNNSEYLSGILLVQYVNQNGALEWTDKLEATVPPTAPGKGQGGWSTYTVASTQIVAIKWISLKIGHKVIVELPEERQARLDRERIAKEIEERRKADAIKRKELEAERERLRIENENQRKKALAESEIKKKREAYEKQAVAAAEVRREAYKKREQEVAAWNAKEQQRIEAKRTAIIENTNRQIQANNQFVTDFNNALMAGLQARKEKQAAQESYKKALTDIENGFVGTPSSMKSMALQALAKRFAQEAAQAAYEESTVASDMRATQAATSDPLTKGMYALGALFANSTSSSHTRDAVNKHQKYQKLYEASLMEDATQGVAEQDRILSTLGLDLSGGAGSVTPSKMHPLPGLYTLKGVIRKSTTKVSLVRRDILNNSKKMFVSDVKKKPAVKDLDVSYERNDYEAQWSSRPVTQWELILQNVQGSVNLAEGSKELVKDGKASKMSMTAPLSLFEQLANARSSKDASKLPKVPSPEVQPTLFTVEPIKYGYYAKLPHGSQEWNTDAPLLGDIIRLYGLNLGGKGKESTFDLREKVTGPMSRGQSLNTEVEGFGSLRNVKGCSEKVALVKYAWDSGYEDPIYSTSDEGQLVPSWKVLLKYATSGRAVIGCETGFTYYEEFNSQNKSVTFCVSELEPSSEVPEFYQATNEERSAWIDWHQQSFGVDSLIKKYGFEKLYDHYTDLEKLSPGNGFQWAVTGGIVEQVGANLKSDAPSKYADALLKQFVKELVDAGDVSYAVDLAWPWLSKSPVSALSGSQYLRKSDRDAVIRNVLQTRFDQIDYSFLENWPSVDYALPDDLKSWNYLREHKLADLYPTAARLIAEKSPSKEDREQYSARYFFDFAKDPAAKVAVFQVLGNVGAASVAQVDSHDVVTALKTHAEAFARKTSDDEGGSCPQIEGALNLLFTRGDLAPNEILEVLSMPVVVQGLAAATKSKLLVSGLRIYGSDSRFVSALREGFSSIKDANAKYAALQAMMEYSPTQGEIEVLMTMSADRGDKAVLSRTVDILLSQHVSSTSNAGGLNDSVGQLIKQQMDEAAVSRAIKALTPVYSANEIFAKLSCFINEGSSGTMLATLADAALNAKQLDQASEIIPKAKANGGEVTQLEKRLVELLPKKVVKPTPPTTTTKKKKGGNSW